MIRRRLKQVVSVLRESRDRARIWRQDETSAKEFWSRVPDLEIVSSLKVGRYSPDVVRIVDVDGDGDTEAILLSTPGMYKSKLYQRFQRDIREHLNAQSQMPFKLSVVKNDGELLWSVGEDYEEDGLPYLSHAPEWMVDVFVHPSDGRHKIAVLDNACQLRVFDAQTGTVEVEFELDADNYSIVKIFTESPNDSSRIYFLVGVTDRSYEDPRTYANPWMVIDEGGRVIWKKNVLGAGHSFIIHDFDGDGYNELLIGYELLRIDGRRVWITEGVDASIHDPLEEHVDTHALIVTQNTRAVGIAASSFQYLIDFSGKVIWRKTLPHPQSCLIGAIDGRPVLAVLNQRDPMNVISLEGEPLISVNLPEYWPTRRPVYATRKMPIHTDIPAVPVYHRGELLPSHFLYLEGGVPYICDFSGDVKYRFPQINLFSDGWGRGFRRINDIGISFEAADPTVPHTSDAGIRLFRRSELVCCRFPGE